MNTPPDSQRPKRSAFHAIGSANSSPSQSTRSPASHQPDSVVPSASSHIGVAAANPDAVIPKTRYEYPFAIQQQSSQHSIREPDRDPVLGDDAHHLHRRASSNLSSTSSTTSSLPPLVIVDFLPHASIIEHTTEILQTNITTGLTQVEAMRRLKQWGPNTISIPSISLLHVIREELTEPLILLLLVVAGLYALWGKLEEAITAMVVILLTVSLELWTEYRAKVAVLKLQSCTFSPPVSVLRDGVLVAVPKEQLVRGDVMDIHAGERLTADARIIASTWLLVDESALTGEARAVSKDATIILPATTPLTQRRNCVFAGTIVTHGSARVVVTATSGQTQIGQIKSLASAAGKKIRAGRTPMQVMMKELALQLTVVAAIACMVVMTLGFMRGLAYQTVVLMGLSLAFATIPEELPILIKAVLAVGALQLSRKNVLVKSLKTAESLGGISLVLTDKTGTLTRNELNICRLAMPGLVLKVPRPPAAPGQKAMPFHASTEDMLAFEPLIAQGWFLSSPTLIDKLTQRRSLPASSTSILHPSSSSPPFASHQEQDVVKLTHLAEAALDHAFSTTSSVSPLVLDPFDAAFLRFFAQKRTLAQDLNSTFLRRLFTESLVSAASSQLMYVLPYDPLRRRSSCIRHVTTMTGPSAIVGGDPSTSGQLRLCARGGAEFILSACSYALHADGHVIKLTPESREELRAGLMKMADAGLRIMGFAVRRLEQKELDKVLKSTGVLTKSSSVASSAHTAAAEQSDGLSEEVEEETHHSTSTSTSISTPTANSTTSSPPFSPYLSPTDALTSLETRLTFLGFLGFGDTLREGVASSVHALQQAGIQVKLVTGDFERTGAAVARAVGVLPPMAMKTNGNTTMMGGGVRNNNGRGALIGGPNTPGSKSKFPSQLRYGDSSDDEEVGNSARTARTSKFAQPSPSAPSTTTDSSSSKHSSTSTRRTSVRDAVASKPEAIEGVCCGALRSVSTTGTKTRRGGGPSGASNSSSDVGGGGGVSATSSNVNTPKLTPMPPPTAIPVSSVKTPSSQSSLSSSSPSPSPPMPHYDLNARVYCRMTPQDKLNLVLAHRELGHSILVTGDGANDSAALAAADAGLAMGSTACGTDLAREMAGIILMNDDFRGVVVAVQEGRRTLENLSKAIRFYLACKLALILLFLTPLACGYDLPLNPIHVILLECFLDLGASAGFTFEIGDPNLMQRSPKEWSRDKFMKGRKLKWMILGCALLLFTSVASVLFVAHHMEVRVGHAPPSQLNSIVFQDFTLPELSPLDLSLSTNDGFLSASSTMPSMKSVDHATSKASTSPSSRAPLPPSTNPSSHHPPVYVPPPEHEEYHHSSSSSEQEHHGRSSSSFFPSILPTYQHDPHLQLTHSLVLVTWLLASVFLANFMRNFQRSFLFACCDRRSIKRIRDARKRSNSIEATPFTTAKSSSTLLTSQRQVNYNTLESGFGGGAAVGSDSPETRLDGRESEPLLEQSDYESETSVSSFTTAGTVTGSSQQKSPDELEGLIKRSIASRTFDPRDDTTFASVVFPLLINPLMLAWTVLSCGFAFLAVTQPWLRHTLALTAIDVDVAIPALFGSEFVFPAYYVLLLPITIFLAAELTKFVMSFLRTTEPTA